MVAAREALDRHAVLVLVVLVLVRAAMRAALRRAVNRPGGLPSSTLGDAQVRGPTLAVKLAAALRASDEPWAGNLRVRVLKVRLLNVPPHTCSAKLLAARS